MPIRPGSHTLRVQSLADVRLWPIAGAVKVPGEQLPDRDEQHGGHGRPPRERASDRRARRRSRALGLLARRSPRARARDRASRASASARGRRARSARSCTAGLWFVSREGFVFASGGLFVVGAIFLASRFIRGTKLLVASGGIIVVALFGGRCALTDGATNEPTREMFVEHPQHPDRPRSRTRAVAADGSLDTKAGITPVSLSIPTSERYVQSSRQLVTKERPFAMRIVYVTSNLVTGLQLAWLVAGRRCSAGSTAIASPA